MSAGKQALLLRASNQKACFLMLTTKTPLLCLVPGLNTCGWVFRPLTNGCSECSIDEIIMVPNGRILEQRQLPKVSIPAQILSWKPVLEICVRIWFKPLETVLPVLTLFNLLFIHQFPYVRYWLAVLATFYTLNKEFDLFRRSNRPIMFNEPLYYQAFRFPDWSLNHRNIQSLGFRFIRNMSMSVCFFQHTLSLFPRTQILYSETLNLEPEVVDNTSVFAFSEKKQLEIPKLFWHSRSQECIIMYLRFLDIMSIMQCIQRHQNIIHIIQCRPHHQNLTSLTTFHIIMSGKFHGRKKTYKWTPEHLLLHY